MDAFCQFNPVTGVPEEGRGTWDEASFTLRFTFCAALELDFNPTYRVSFEVMNPLVKQVSPVGISLNGNGAIYFPPQILNKPDTTALGKPYTLNPKP